MDKIIYNSQPFVVSTDKIMKRTPVSPENKKRLELIRSLMKFENGRIIFCDNNENK